jgi:hypothetical protein
MGGEMRIKSADLHFANISMGLSWVRRLFWSKPTFMKCWVEFDYLSATIPILVNEHQHHFRTLSSQPLGCLKSFGIFLFFSYLHSGDECCPSWRVRICCSTNSRTIVFVLVDNYQCASKNFNPPSLSSSSSVSWNSSICCMYIYTQTILCASLLSLLWHLLISTS